MTAPASRLQRVGFAGIWGLALGYFLFYIPYSGLIKILSLGLFPGMDGPRTGLELLPASALATSTCLPLFITLIGWWKYVPMRRWHGLVVPEFRVATLASGVATAVIIGTTTLNYTFEGISILLALLLMRGGVLVMAPVVDRLNHRRIRLASVVALFLSLGGIAIAFADVDGYRMTFAAGLNVCAYLLGYVFRLRLMTRIGKSPDNSLNIRYFVEETIVAAVALTVVPLFFALFASGSVGDQLRTGFTTILQSSLAWPALTVGILYASLYVCGSLIYLHRRENTFCIPLNRCASLLSGVVSSYLLAALLGLASPSTYQLVATVLLVLSVVCLAWPLFMATAKTRSVTREAWLFICGGNTIRSPLAAAICRARVGAALGISEMEMAQAGISFNSAGLSTTGGQQLSDKAHAILQAIGFDAFLHVSRSIDLTMIRTADRIFCMTDEQCHTLRQLFPSAASRIQRLHSHQDIPDPHESDEEAAAMIGKLMLQAIGQRLAEVQISVV